MDFKYIKCSDCGAMFSHSKLGNRMIEDQKLKFYFIECPICHSKKLYMITDSKLERLIEEQRKIFQQIAICQKSGLGIPSAFERTRNHLRGCILKRQKRLKKKFAKRFEKLIEFEDVCTDLERTCTDLARTNTTNKESEQHD